MSDLREVFEMRRTPGSGRSSFSGVIPPLVTPLTADGEVDLAGLTKLIDHLLEAGVDGVFMLGSTGEGAFLTDERRRIVVARTVEHVAGRVPVLVGTPDTATDRVIAQARVVQDAGADAIVVTSPYYGHVGVTEIAAHFRAVAAAVRLPVIAYDNPAVVYNRLDTDMLVELAREGVIAAVKDSSGDLTALRRLLRATEDLESFTVFTGSEVLTDVAFALGAHGVVPGLGNVDAAGYVRLYHAACDGRADDAASEQERLIRLFSIVDVADRERLGRLGVGVGAFKAAMVAQGLIDTPTLCPPFGQLTRQETERVTALVEAAGLWPPRKPRTSND